MSLHDQPDPGQLLRLAHAGHKFALGQLLESYRDYLTLLARLQIGRHLQSKADPEDLIQETFLEAHRHFRNFRGTTEEEFLSWLRQILATSLAHLVRRYCGTQRRNVQLERELALELEESSMVLNGAFVSKQSSPSQRAARQEEAVLLAKALAHLPEDYREVLILRHVEGLTFAEVARRMDRTLDSVDKLWMRALNRLRRCPGGVA